MIRYLKIKYARFMVWLMLVMYHMGWGTASQREEAMLLYQEFMKKTAAK